MVTFDGRPPATLDEYVAKWRANLANPAIVARTIVDASTAEIAGYVSIFPRGADREIGYWLGRSLWGRGLATAAVREMLRLVADRPLIARVAKHNTASLRVVEKNGFVIQRSDRYQPVPDGPFVDEWVLQLRSNA